MTCFSTFPRPFEFITYHRSVQCTVLTFLVVDFSRQSLSVLLQYLSTRYAIPIAKVRSFCQICHIIYIGTVCINKRLDYRFLGQPLSFLQGLCATDNLNRRPAARKPVRLKKARTLPLSKGLCSLAAESRSYNGMLCHSGCGPKHTYGGNR